MKTVTRLQNLVRDNVKPTQVYSRYYYKDDGNTFNDFIYFDGEDIETFVEVRTIVLNRLKTILKNPSLKDSDIHIFNYQNIEDSLCINEAIRIILTNGIPVEPLYLPTMEQYEQGEYLGFTKEEVDIIGLFGEQIKSFIQQFLNFA